MALLLGVLGGPRLSVQPLSTLHPSLIEELGGDQLAVTIVTDLPSAMRVVGKKREEFQQQLADAVDLHADTIGARSLSHLGNLLPPGLQGEISDARLTGFQVDDVVEAWGVWTAFVYGDLDFDYTGTLNELEYHAFREGGEAPRFYANEFDWDEEQRYAIVTGSGSVEVIVEVTYDPRDDKLDVTNALLADPDEEP